MREWDAGEALRLIEAERVTDWTGVPSMVQDMLLHKDFEARDTSSLKSIGGTYGSLPLCVDSLSHPCNSPSSTGGGAPTPSSQVTKVMEKFENGETGVMQGYGLTETNGGLCFNKGVEYQVL